MVERKINTNEENDLKHSIVDNADGRRALPVSILAIKKKKFLREVAHFS